MNQFQHFPQPTSFASILAELPRTLPEISDTVVDTILEGIKKTREGMCVQSDEFYEYCIRQGFLYLRAHAEHRFTLQLTGTPSKLSITPCLVDDVVDISLLTNYQGDQVKMVRECIIRNAQSAMGNLQKLKIKFHTLRGVDKNLLSRMTVLHQIASCSEWNMVHYNHEKNIVCASMGWWSVAVPFEEFLDICAQTIFPTPHFLKPLRAILEDTHLVHISQKGISNYDSTGLSMVMNALYDHHLYKYRDIFTHQFVCDGSTLLQLIHYFFEQKTSTHKKSSDSITQEYKDDTFPPHLILKTQDTLYGLLPFLNKEYVFESIGNGTLERLYEILFSLRILLRISPQEEEFAQLIEFIDRIDFIEKEPPVTHSLIEIMTKDRECLHWLEQVESKIHTDICSEFFHHIDLLGQLLLSPDMSDIELRFLKRMCALFYQFQCIRCSSYQSVPTYVYPTYQVQVGEGYVSPEPVHYFPALYTMVDLYHPFSGTQEKKSVFMQEVQIFVQQCSLSWKKELESERIRDVVEFVCDELYRTDMVEKALKIVCGCKTEFETLLYCQLVLRRLKACEKGEKSHTVPYVFEGLFKARIYDSVPFTEGKGWFSIDALACITRYVEIHVSSILGTLDKTVFVPTISKIVQELFYSESLEKKQVIVTDWGVFFDEEVGRIGESIGFINDFEPSIHGVVRAILTRHDRDEISKLSRIVHSGILHTDMYTVEQLYTEVILQAIYAFLPKAFRKTCSVAELIRMINSMCFERNTVYFNQNISHPVHESLQALPPAQCEQVDHNLYTHMMHHGYNIQRISLLYKQLQSCLTQGITLKTLQEALYTLPEIQRIQYICDIIIEYIECILDDVPVSRIPDPLSVMRICYALETVLISYKSNLREFDTHVLHEQFPVHQQVSFCQAIQTEYSRYTIKQSDTELRAYINAMQKNGVPNSTKNVNIIPIPVFESKGGVMKYCNSHHIWYCTKPTLLGGMPHYYEIKMFKTYILMLVHSFLLLIDEIQNIQQEVPSSLEYLKSSRTILNVILADAETFHYTVSDVFRVIHENFRIVNEIYNRMSFQENFELQSVVTLILSMHVLWKEKSENLLMCLTCAFPSLSRKTKPKNGDEFHISSFMQHVVDSQQWPCTSTFKLFVGAKSSMYHEGDGEMHAHMSFNILPDDKESELCTKLWRCIERYILYSIEIQPIMYSNIITRLRDLGSSQAVIDNYIKQGITMGIRQKYPLLKEYNLENNHIALHPSEITRETRILFDPCNTHHYLDTSAYIPYVFTGLLVENMLKITLGKSIYISNLSLVNCAEVTINGELGGYIGTPVQIGKISMDNSRVTLIAVQATHVHMQKSILDISSSTKFANRISNIHASHASTLFLTSQQTIPHCDISPDTKIRYHDLSINRST